MLESEIERKVVHWARNNGFLSLKLNVRGQVGWPDRLFLKNGKALFMEFKTKKGNLRPMQIARIRELALKANFPTQIVRSVEAGIMVLQTWNRL